MSGTDGAAQLEATVFLEFPEDVPDHRQRIKVLYPLDEVFLLSLMAALAGAEGFTDIARFGEKKLDLLRRFRPFVHGTPSHDQLGDIFAALDADAFRTCFVRWVATLTDTPAEVIAIDGKTSRRSGRKGAKDALHTVSAPDRGAGQALRRAAEPGAGAASGSREIERGQGFSPPQAQNRRMGRRFPRKPHLIIINSPDCPDPLPFPALLQIELQTRFSELRGKS